MDRRIQQFFLIFMLMTLLMPSVFACPCFTRHYLYSIFHSEKHDAHCMVSSNMVGDTRDHIVYLVSYNKNHFKKPSNYGEVSSHARHCKLLIDNQSIYARYESDQDKVDCDLEIIGVCNALHLKIY